MLRFFSLLSAALWKNILLKKARWIGLIAEIIIPVLFMALLSFFKSVSDVYDVPNIAYFCGQTVPFSYATTSDLSPLSDCMIKPDGCSADNYYKIVDTNNGETNYTQLGYVSSAQTNSFYPFYAATVADTEYDYSSYTKPSLTFTEILEHIDAVNSKLAIVPGSTDINVQEETLKFYNYTLEAFANVTNPLPLLWFDTESELRSYIKDNSYNEVGYANGKIAFAIVLDSIDHSTNEWEYTIRANYTQWYTDEPTVACLYNKCGYTYGIPSTQFYTDTYSVPFLADSFYGYFFSGFLSVQKFVDEYIITQSANTSEHIHLNVSMGLFPSQSYYTDNFQSLIADVLGLFYMLSFIYLVSRFIGTIVIEKEAKIKEGMKMMGMTDLAYNLSWFLTMITEMVIIDLLLIIVGGNSVFEHSSKSLIYLWFFAFSLSIVMMIFLLTIFFDKSRTAAIMGTMIFFGSYFPIYAVDGITDSRSSKLGACLLSPTCFALGASVVAEFEGSLTGLHYNNYNEQVYQFSMQDCIAMLFVDSVIYGLLALYLNKVWISEYGTHLPWYFPVLPSYWFPNFFKHSKKLNFDSFPAVDFSNIDEDESSNEGARVESIDKEFRKQQIQQNKCVLVKDLRKVYKTTGEDRVAVKKLHLELFEGQITVLLGHNGAGKSTTISMLTGLINPTSGDAMILGNKLTEDIQEIRESLGVCPQHDVLFPDLTVKEHLNLFAVLKKVPRNQIDDEVLKIIHEVGLVEKTNVQSKMLSGGMKRKLSLAIAFIGDSKIIILDEPTSGMDPFSRRSTWNILQRNKQNRIILLTTHFMDEADILGDRIAIMAEGELRCVGSSLFLKDVYGVGYTLTVVRSEHAIQGQGGSDIQDLVKKRVPQAEVLSNVGAEQSFRLPFEASAYFVELFREFDQKKELKIAEYGVSVTTLEEVFIQVGHGTSHEDGRKSSTINVMEEEKKNDSSNKQTFDIEFGKKEDNLRAMAHTEPEFNVFISQFVALLKKRYLYSKRDIRAVIYQLIVPTILVLLGVVLLIFQPSSEQPNLLLSPKIYNTKYKDSMRNVFPVNTSNSIGELVANAMGNNQYTTVVEIMDEVPDQFASCANNGADVLHRLSNILIDTPEELTSITKGASIYGAAAIGDLTNNNNSFSYSLLVNASGYHSPAIYMNLVDSAFLQVITNSSTAKITTNNHPLPLSYVESNNIGSVNAFFTSLIIIIAFCFLPASFAVFVVREREVKAKHQQIISGVSIYAYWLTTFLWDSISNLIPSSITIILLAAFSIGDFTSSNLAGATVGIFFLFGPAVAGLTYCISFLFKSHSMAQNIILFFNFITGLCLMITSFVLGLITSTQSFNYRIKFLFRLFPLFCLGDTLLSLSFCEEGECAKLTTAGYSDLADPLDLDVAGWNLLFLGLEAIIYFIFTLIIEYLLSIPSFIALFQTFRDTDLNPQIDDEDVQAEFDRVASGKADNDVICLKNLRKVYQTSIGTKIAVKGLSFGVPKGECFGFLGINGAGKSTTLSILSGEFPPTNGAAYIAGLNILTEQNRIRRRIGYCPQFDALLELLTVREHLELYAKIKAVDPSKVQFIVDEKIKQLDLQDFENKAAGSLSGGNKRKLSVAIAMMGEPDIIFLDEPSTGMDPVARRFMWEVISKLSTRDQTCSIILTTHSMEEAEALCSRIGIMVNGQLKCLGSSQHLKYRFGRGFEVNIKTKTTSDEVNAATKRVESVLIGQENIQNDTQLLEACQALGNKEWFNLISPGNKGHFLRERMITQGSIPIHVFCEWWLDETKAELLHQFISTSFHGSELVERSSSVTFKYKFAQQEIPLADIFASFEREKQRIGVGTYSIGQTTFEQIFNYFAGRSDNPEVDFLNTDDKP